MCELSNKSHFTQFYFSDTFSFSQDPCSFPGVQYKNGSGTLSHADAVYTMSGTRTCRWMIQHKVSNMYMALFCMCISSFILSVIC